MNILIIGNGIAGATAARYIRKWGDHKITMISNESNYPFSRTALMYIFMGHMKFEHTKLYEDSFWQKNRIELLNAEVSEIKKDAKELVLSSGKGMPYDKLIIATGSKSNKFGWPGQDLPGVHGLYHLNDLKDMEKAHARGVKHAVIVGGGLIGIEMAEMWHSRHVGVTMLVRENNFWDIVLPDAEATMISDHIRKNGIDLRLKTELGEILGSEWVNKVTQKDGAEIECQFVGLTVGVSPNVDVAKKSGLEVGRGILVDNSLMTSDSNIYAIGDCAELRTPIAGRRSIEAVWYVGRMMGQIAAAKICNKPFDYTQDVWFNSAKFFDIEYQVYGNVPTAELEGVDSLVWIDKEKEKVVRLVYDVQTKAIIGINLLGVRMRSEICIAWIKGKVLVDQVIRDLGAANFDPEFFERYEYHLAEAYRNKFGESLLQNKSRGVSFASTLFNKLIRS